MNKPFFRMQWAMIALTLTACGPSTAPTEGDKAGVRQTPDGMAPTRADELNALIQEVRDHLAEDRTAQAQAAMSRLRALKDGLPPDRQADIDRLDAMFADESSTTDTPFNH